MTPEEATIKLTAVIQQIKDAGISVTSDDGIRVESRYEIVSYVWEDGNPTRVYRAWTDVQLDNETLEEK